ncbi:MULTISPECIES: alpha/beta hydrolase [unclassified Wolbachia]|uniref:alpha/beta hydrolase n=1 Tax=unclassified Wolbachia TaxID=2640676 RepID=UPI0022309B25|nr:alpha/beta hydrolase [Wolbachia endosymbiont (group A) of Apoderus coryli]
MKETREIKIQTKEEFVRTQNGMKIQKIIMPSKDVDQRNGKHLVYFVGGGNRIVKSKELDLQNWQWATDRGITVHLFNYPGLGKSKNSFTFRNDRVESGIVVVTDLLKNGIKPDNIILFGDCFGGHVAAEVHKNFKNNDIHLRCVVSNAASSLKQASLYYFGFIAKLKILLAPIIKLVLKIFGCHWKTHKIINSITPYTMYFNREGDKTIKQSAQLATKIERIEKNGRKKNYQKKEVFEGFEENEKFFKQHTMLIKNNECIDPKRTNKGIHGLPIKCLKSSNKVSYTFPELISLYIQKTDSYFAECGSLNSEEKVEEFRKSKFYEDFSGCTSSMSKVNITAANRHPAGSYESTISSTLSK